MPRLAAVFPTRIALGPALGPALALALGLAGTAAAQDSAAPTDGDVRVVVTKADCSRLVKYVPAPDVTYRPGIDVNGDPVAPADLDGGVSIALPETFVIPIEVDLFDRFGIPADPTNYEGDLVVGEVIVDLDGRAYFNGQPLQDEEAAALAAKCQEVLRGGE